MSAVTGKSLLKNPTLFQLITDSLAAGESLLAVSKKFKVSRDTIRAALAQPKARQFTSGTIAKLERIVTKGLDRYEEAMDDGKISPGSIPVSVGIFLDKKLALESQTNGKPVEEIGPDIMSVKEELANLTKLIQPVQVNVQINSGQSSAASSQAGSSFGSA